MIRTTAAVSIYSNLGNLWRINLSLSVSANLQVDVKSVRGFYWVGIHEIKRRDAVRVAFIRIQIRLVRNRPHGVTYFLRFRCDDLKKENKYWRTFHKNVKMKLNKFNFLCYVNDGRSLTLIWHREDTEGLIAFFIHKFFVDDFNIGKKPFHTLIDQITKRLFVF